MRDPNRIHTFCELLEKEWTKVFDWRFGQFLCNFLGYVWQRAQKDIFYIEDDEMKNYLQKYLESFKEENGNNNVNS